MKPGGLQRAPRRRLLNTKSGQKRPPEEVKRSLWEAKGSPKETQKTPWGGPGAAKCGGPAASPSRADVHPGATGSREESGAPGAEGTGTSAAQPLPPLVTGGNARAAAGWVMSGLCHAMSYCFGG